MKTNIKAGVAFGAALALVGGNAAFGATMTETGPSTQTSPYVVPVADGISTTSVLTVGDTINGYPMVGVPDGLGAYDNGDGTFTVLMNHEIKPDQGAQHAHGAAGAFVSKWIVRNDLTVLSGEDLIKRVMDYDFATGSWTEITTAFNRFCSSDLGPAGSFYDSASGTGTKELLYLTGEEAGAEGRGTATVATGPDAGTAYLLPWAGKMSFENMLVHPNTGKQTIVTLTDDSGGGEVYVYVGEKRDSGNEVERAGLVGGKLYGVKIEGVLDETDATSIGTGVPFSLVEVPGAEAMTGAQLEEISGQLGITSFARPEDGSWDPSNANGFYFTTTGSFEGISRLWHLMFTDVVGNVLAGGTATVPVESPAYDPALPSQEQKGPRMLDNMTVNANGVVHLQEDPGKQEYISGIWRLKNGTLEKVAQHDPARFSAPSTDAKADTAGSADAHLTIDEESSGIIPLPFLGEGKYLLDVQAHYPLDQTLVQGGQLLVMDVEDEKTSQPTATSTATENPTQSATAAPTASQSTAPTSSSSATPTATPTSGANTLASSGSNTPMTAAFIGAGLIALGGAAYIVARMRRQA